MFGYFGLIEFDAHFVCTRSRSLGPMGGPSPPLLASLGDTCLCVGFAVSFHARHHSRGVCVGDLTLLHHGDGCRGYRLFFGCIVMPQLHMHLGRYWVFCHPFGAPPLFLWHPDLTARGGYFFVASPIGHNAAFSRAPLRQGGHRACLSILDTGT